jgi:hypothetical protein
VSSVERTTIEASCRRLTTAVAVELRWPAHEPDRELVDALLSFNVTVDEMLGSSPRDPVARGQLKQVVTAFAADPTRVQARRGVGAIKGHHAATIVETEQLAKTIVVATLAVAGDEVGVAASAVKTVFAEADFFEHVDARSVRAHLVTFGGPANPASELVDLVAGLSAAYQNFIKRPLLRHRERASNPLLGPLHECAASLLKLTRSASHGR